MPTTGSGKFPYPNSSAVPDVPADVLLLGQRVDKIASGWTVCADAAARAALVTNSDAYEGLHVYQIDTGVIYTYLSSAWVAGTGPKIGGRVVRANTSVTFSATTWTGATTSADWTTTGGKAPSGGLASFNGTWVAPIAGHYRVEAQISLAAAVNLILAIKKNDTASSTSGAILLNTATGTSSFTAAEVGGTVKLAANDVLRLYVFPSGSAGWNTTTDFSYFGIEYVEGV
jgi:hypothetical protein